MDSTRVEVTSCPTVAFSVCNMAAAAVTVTSCFTAPTDKVKSARTSLPTLTTWSA